MSAPITEIALLTELDPEFRRVLFDRRRADTIEDIREALEKSEMSLKDVSGGGKIALYMNISDRDARFTFVQPEESGTWSTGNIRLNFKFDFLKDVPIDTRVAYYDALDAVNRAKAQGSNEWTAADTARRAAHDVIAKRIEQCFTAKGVEFKKLAHDVFTDEAFRLLSGMWMLRDPANPARIAPARGIYRRPSSDASDDPQ